MADVSQITVGEETRDIKDSWARKMSVPNWSTTEKFTLTPSSPFTAPKDGWVVGTFQGLSNTTTEIKVNGVTISSSLWSAGGWIDMSNINIPVLKGNTLTINYNPHSQNFYFCPIED